MVMASAPVDRGEDCVSSHGTFVSRTILQDISMFTDEDHDEVQITCVEFWDGNLYVGTSQGTVLHFVSFLQDASSTTPGCSFIFASKLSANSGPATKVGTLAKGIQRILLLPRVSKACVLSSGTLSFYSLPELSPALNNTVVSNCTWVGGLDLSNETDATEESEIIMICIQKRIRLVRIGDEARLVKNIEYPNCLISARRHGFACVADANSYALIDIDNQRKITLFPISSLDENSATGAFEDISHRPESSLGRPLSGIFNQGNKGHSRNISLGSFVPQTNIRQASPRMPSPNHYRSRADLLDQDKAEDVSSRRDRASSVPENIVAQAEKPLPSTPDIKDPSQTVPLSSDTRNSYLRPQICSPTPEEFLLTTGTGYDEAGVGLFVNLEGEVVRGTLRFHRYPRSLVIDERICSTSSRGSPEHDPQQSLVFAAIGSNAEEDKHVIQIQRWDVEDPSSTEWLSLPRPRHDTPSNGQDKISDIDYFLGSVNDPIPWVFSEVGTMLQGSRLSLPGAERSAILQQSAQDSHRLKEEQVIGHRLGKSTSPVVVWSSRSISIILKQPLATRLNHYLDAALYAVAENEVPTVDRTAIFAVTQMIQNIECASETDFLSLNFIRQKSSFILFADLLFHSSDSIQVPDQERQLIERLLIESNLDPRIILSLTPLLVDDIFESDNGIWVHTGLLDTVEDYQRFIKRSSTITDIFNPVIFTILKHFLSTLRQRKGFGSVSSENEIFQSIDASLLHLLLERDEIPKQKAKTWSSRSELYALVDSGLDCFERAQRILKQYDRLYVLSRLYGARKMPERVLETWQTILQGSGDARGEFQDGENELRKYLAKVRDRNLVEEYGVWLARRNPAQGVQVFTEDQSRVKLEPQQTVELLQARAPTVVKVYLEHLVFGKKQIHYADRLISYYLDNVITVLENDRSAREILRQTYEVYRAMRPPKPTYRQFLMDNPAEVEWWSDRLRLLELLGGSHGDNFDYDIAHILTRMEPFEELLVPESIILDGRQGKHQQALKLLIHGLGDYHTAINYCLLGGTSMYHPVSGSLVSAASQSREDQIVLFDYLLTEFLAIEALSNRIEQTSELLGRFGSWYDLQAVIGRIPDTWSVEVMFAFFSGAMRRLLQERNEAMVVKALSGAENLQIAAELVAKSSHFKVEKGQVS